MRMGEAEGDLRSAGVRGLETRAQQEANSIWPRA